MYYLPFCNVFTSNDRVHRRIAPLFLTESQSFVRGDELKEEFWKLDALYSALPAEIRERGVMSFAHWPPEDRSFLTTRLWDKHLPGWRADKEAPEVGGEKKAEIAQRVKQARDAAALDTPRASALSKADYQVIESRVPARRGKWRLLPPEVEEEWRQAGN